jgi:hypothetical protein
MNKIMIATLVAMLVCFSVEAKQIQTITIPSNTTSIINSATITNNIGLPRDYLLSSMFIDLGGASAGTNTIIVSVSNSGKTYVVDTVSVALSDTRARVDFDLPIYVAWGETVTVSRTNATVGGAFVGTNVVYTSMLVLE